MDRLALRNAATSLRLLNALRTPTIGVPLTLRQLDKMTMPVLIQRLVSMHHHLLALRIAAAVGLKSDPVMPAPVAATLLGEEKALIYLSALVIWA